MGFKLVWQLFPVQQLIMREHVGIDLQDCNSSRKLSAFGF